MSIEWAANDKFAKKQLEHRQRVQTEKENFGIVNVINYELVNRKQQVKTFPLQSHGLLGIMLVVGLAVGMEFKIKCMAVSLISWIF